VVPEGSYIQQVAAVELKGRNTVADTLGDPGGRASDRSAELLQRLPGAWRGIRGAASAPSGGGHMKVRASEVLVPVLVHRPLRASHARRPQPTVAAARTSPASGECVPGCPAGQCRSSPDFP
jgi:hypothetical protein